MHTNTTDKIRKAFNDTKDQRRSADHLNKAISIFENNLQVQSINFREIYFNDVILSKTTSLSGSVCYICNEKVLVVYNVSDHPDCVADWKIRKCEVGDQIKEAIVFFEKGSGGVSEIDLSKYEIDNKREK